MKFVSVRDLRNKSGQMWKDLKKEQELILTRNGQPNAMLISLDAESLEYMMKTVRKAKAIEALRRLQEASMINGTSNMTMEEINEEIEAARRENEEL